MFIRKEFTSAKWLNWKKSKVESRLKKIIYQIESMDPWNSIALSIGKNGKEDSIVVLWLRYISGCWKVLSLTKKKLRFGQSENFHHPCMFIYKINRNIKEKKNKLIIKIVYILISIKCVTTVYKKKI